MPYPNPIDPNIKSVNGDVYQVRENYLVPAMMFESQLIIPSGFKSDLASIPRPFRWIFDRASLGITAPIVHDYLCDTKGVGELVNGDHVNFTSSTVHFLFFVLMWIDGVPKLRATLAYLAVALFGPRF